MKQQNQASAVSRVETTNADNFVTVACKLPHGLHLDVEGKRITLKGANAPGALAGYGLTYVPEAFWNAWLAIHKNYPPVKNDLIFALKKTNDVRAAIKERKGEVVSGLEPLDPSKPILRGVTSRDDADPTGDLGQVELDAVPVSGGNAGGDFSDEG